MGTTCSLPVGDSGRLLEVVMLRLDPCERKPCIPPPLALAPALVAGPANATLLSWRGLISTPKLVAQTFRTLLLGATACF